MRFFIKKIKNYALSGASNLNVEQRQRLDLKMIGGEKVRDEEKCENWCGSAAGQRCQATAKLMFRKIVIAAFWLTFKRERERENPMKNYSPEEMERFFSGENGWAGHRS